MSCPPEPTWMLYADGELGAGERAAAESHLVGCRRCRERVLALRDEATLLADVLRECAPAAAPVALPAEPRPRAGLGPALGAAACAALVLGWAFAGLRSSEPGWLTFFSLRGAIDMAFDLVFWARDEAPALFEVAVGVAAMASVSALLTLALTAALRRVQGPRTLLLGVLLALAAGPGEGRAHFGLHEHEDYALPAGEVHDGTLVVSARSVSVDGLVDGDVVAFTERLAVRGEVRGNVIAIARNAEIQGEVEGSLHLLSARAHVSGEVGGSLYAAGEDLTVAAPARIGRDLAVLAESAAIEGRVARDAFLAGDRAEVRGSVARHVRAWAERLAILDGAAVGGDLTARLPEGREVEVAPGARVAGEIQRLEPAWQGRRGGLDRFASAGLYLWMAFHLAAGFVVGIALRAVAPGLLGGRLASGAEFFRTVGVGLLAAVAAPVALGLVAITVIGIPLALLGLAAYAAMLYLAAIALAVLVGRSVVGSRAEAWGAFAAALGVGLAIVVLAFHLPWIGGLLRLVGIATGIGLLVDRAREARLGLPAPAGSTAG